MLFVFSIVLRINLVSGLQPELQRLNYGVVFEPQHQLQMGIEHWTHTFAVELPTSLNILSLSGCSRDKETCKFVNQVLLEINQIRQDTAVMMNSTIESILRLIPERNLVNTERRSRRSLLPFIGDLSKSLFGTATFNDVQRLASHINALNRFTRNMAHSIQQHDDKMSSYMHAVDNRINNIVDGLKQNALAIEHIQTQLYASFNDLENSFSTMNVLIAKQIQKSRKLEHLYNELLDGVYNLVEGKLSPHLVSPSVMSTTLQNIQALLHEKYNKHFLVFTHPQQVYSNVECVFARKNLTLYISVKFPISSFHKPLLLFKVLSFPVPVNNTSTHATQLLTLPQYIAVTADMQYYTTLTDIDLSHCVLSKFFTCKFTKTLYPFTHDTCVSALFKNDKVQVKDKCDFRFLLHHLDSGLVQLTRSEILVYNMDSFELDCKSGRKVNPGCSFCIINISCECAISTPNMYIAPRLSACHQNTSTVLHPINLALLQQFFNDTVLENIESNTLFQKPLSINVPEFKIFNHTIQHIIANDKKADLSLERMAKSVKNDDLVYQYMTDPLLTGDVSITKDWLSWDDIMLYCTTAVAIISLTFVLLLCVKMRKLIIIVSVLQKAQISKASTLPSFVYTKKQTTAEPSFTETIDLTVNHYVLALVLITLLLVIIQLVKKCNFRHLSTVLIIEITNGKECVHIPLHYLSLCPSYWTIRVPGDIQCIEIQGFWIPLVTFTWDNCFVENKTNGKVSHVSSSVKVSTLTSKKLRKMMKHPYSVQFYVKHENLFVPVN